MRNKKCSRCLKWKPVDQFCLKKLLAAAKHRAKKQRIEFSITEADFPGWREQKYCSVFPWIELNWDRTEHGDDSPSIDRIIPALNYMPGNVRLICWRANALKNNGTAKELAALGEDTMAMK